jgi:hypothetical protein
LSATIAVLAAVFGGASAQQGAASGSIGSIESIGAAEPAMSDSQQLAWVEQQLEVARSVRQQIESMLDQARKEKETLKITCLDDKLTQVAVNVRGMEERSGALREAIGSSDTASANQHMMVLKIYAARVQGLKAEAESCVGDSDVVLGETETSVDIDEKITKEDPSEGDFEIPWVDQPPQASGFY